MDPATGRRPRRWVVERTIGWLNKCRGLLVRYEKKAENYLGMTELACCLIWWRRLCWLHDEPVSGSRLSPSDKTVEDHLTQAYILATL